MFTKSKSLLLALFVLLSIAGLFVATNQNRAKAIDIPFLPETGNACGQPLDRDANWVDASSMNCLDKNWYFDPWSTAGYNMNNQKIIVFRSQDAGDGDVLVILGSNTDGDELKTFCFIDKATVDAGQGFTAPSGNLVQNKCGIVASVENASKPAPGNTCSILKTVDCDPSSSMASGKKTHFSEADWKTATNGQLNKDYLSWIPSAVASANNRENADEACQDAAGTLGFLFCPLFKSISGSIQNILGFKAAGEDGCAPADGTYCINPDSPLQSLLIVRPLQFSSTNTLQQANSNVVTIANSIYVLVFLIIIFMNFIDFGIDNYTIKRLLPRLVAAIIFTQFSYLICAFAIDVGNTLGFAVPNILTGGGFVIDQNPIKIALFAVAGIGNGGTGISILTGVGGFLLALLLMIGVLVALILALIYMVFRLFALYILVLVAPLAIAASVLPHVGHQPN
jgi:hypothetical protein